MGKTRIVSTFHAASAVVASCKCCLTAGNTEHLVVAHPDSIEVYSVHDSGLVFECSTRVWGRILSIKPVFATHTTKSNIFVLLDHPHPELLVFAFTPSEGGTSASLSLAQHALSLYERGGFVSEFYNDLVIHPRGEIAVIGIYQGKIKILTIENGLVKTQSDALLLELSVLSLQIIDNPEASFGLAVLHITHHKEVRLVVHDLEHDELSQALSLAFSPTIISSNTLPCPHENMHELLFAATFTKDEVPGALLLLGGRKILVFALNSEEARRKLHRKLKKAKDDKGKGKECRQVDEKRDRKVRSPTASVQWPFHSITAVCSVSIGSLTWLVGDTFGRTCLLTLDRTESMLTLVVLGETSSAETLTYITNQVFYVGSSSGDSQLVKISYTKPLEDSCPVHIPHDVQTIDDSILITGHTSLTPEEKGYVVASAGSYLEVIQSFKNLSPISDAILVNMDNSQHVQQNQLVTCSGRDNTGSINVIRLGTEFHRKATLSGLTDIIAIWPLRTSYNDVVDSHIGMSTLTETYVFKIGSQSTFIRQGHNVIQGFLDAPSLIVSNILEKNPTGKGYHEASKYVIQVTSNAVRLLECNDVGEYEAVSDWTPPATERSSEIATASISASLILVALSDGQLWFLKVANRNIVTGAIKTNKAPISQHGVTPSHGPKLYPPSWPDCLSCVTCIPFDSRPFTSYFAGAFWHTNQVKVYNTKDNIFTVIWETPMLRAPVKALLLNTFGISNKKEDAYLLVGLADGTLASFKWPDSPGVPPQQLKTVTVGNGPVTISRIMTNNETLSVLAAADKAVIISCENRRLIFSNLGVEGVIATAALNTQHYGNSIILAMPTGLTIGNVDTLTRTYIQSIPLHYSIPEHIVHVETPGMFAVVCKLTRPDRIGRLDTCQYSLRLFEQNTFKLLCQWNAPTDETISSITTVSIRGATLFVVAAYSPNEEDIEVQTGQIKLFSVEQSSVTRLSSQTHQFSLLGSTAISGCPFDLKATPSGLLVAAVNASVQLYRINVFGEDQPSYSLDKISEYSHFYSVSSVVPINERLVVADSLQSVSILQIDGDAQFESLAKDFSPLWPHAITAIDENTIIGLDDGLNLFLLSLEMVRSRPTLVSSGSYHIGATIRKFITGSMTPEDRSTPIESTHLFVTTSGSIGVISQTNDDALANRLIAVQQAMVPVVQGAGGVSHAKYRAPKKTEESRSKDPAFGFLDGDYLKQLSELVEHEEQDEGVRKVCEQSRLRLDELWRDLEPLQSLTM